MLLELFLFEKKNHPLSFNKKRNLVELLQKLEAYVLNFPLISFQISL